MLRREFLRSAAIGSWSALGAAATARGGQPDIRPRLLFTSRGIICLVNADGTNQRTLDLQRPNQTTWQPCGFLADGRLLLLSMEPRRDGPGKPFDVYYHQTPTHIWAYNVDRGTLTVLAVKDRMAPFYAPQLVLRDGRLLMQVIRDKPGQVFSMNLDGSDAREFTNADEGLPYGLSLSPDGKRVAFHLASAQGYQIWTSDVDGKNRVRVAANNDYLYFGPSWSPDGQWLAYQACHFRSDPGHDWSDVCIGRPDGSEQRQLTTEQDMWFGASYGAPHNRGGGSNMVVWTADSHILFPRKLPGSRPPWEFQAERPDVDHFNRDFKPDLARGGVEICTISPNDGAVTSLSRVVPPAWDFRGCESPDGKKIAFCRCRVGEAPSLWVMNRDGSDPQRLTGGLADAGADHPRWWPATG